MPKLSQSVLCVALGALLGGACDSSDDAPAEQVDFNIAITQIDDVTVTGDGESQLTLRCDGSLAVTVQVTPADLFFWRPANACAEGSSCGYVRLEALRQDHTRLGEPVETATTAGVLQIPTAQLAELAVVHAVLVQGYDQEPIETKAGSPVEDFRALSVVLPENCGEASGGAPNAGGAPGGGAGGAEPLPEPLGGAGGAGGAEPVGGAAGAAGTTPTEGGADTMTGAGGAGGGF
jgi:hypothetical protein